MRSKLCHESVQHHGRLLNPPGLHVWLQVRLQGSPAAALTDVANAVRRLQKYSQLYIYSDADVVIPVRAVENFMRVWLLLPMDCSALSCALVQCLDRSSFTLWRNPLAQSWVQQCLRNILYLDNS